VRFGILLEHKRNIFHKNDVKANGKADVVLNLRNFRDSCAPTEGEKKCLPLLGM
jgi:hypothetical protein